MGEKLDEAEDFLYGFKKFIAFLLVLAIASIFRIKNLMDGSNYVDLIKASFIAFCTANGIEHFTTTAKTYIQTNSNTLIAQAKSLVSNSKSQD